MYKEETSTKLRYQLLFAAKNKYMENDIEMKENEVIVSD